MNDFTRDELSQAAYEGTGWDHLTPGQAWAADALDLPLARLKVPLAPSIAVLLQRTEDIARRAFFDPIGPEDAEAMIQAAYDEDHPMFLRRPIMETLREGFNEFFPGLKPSGVDENGNQLFNLADLAVALETSEEELQAHAEEAGFADQLRTEKPNPLH